MKTKTLSIRLAFRIEGNWWVCYAAKSHTMEGALEMGRVGKGIVLNKKYKQTFMNLMKDAFADFVEEQYGERPDAWVTEQGPESERSGHA